MANELCTSLGLSGKDLTGKTVAILEEHGSDASFLLGSLMWNLFNTNSSLCFVALHNSSLHYQNVAKRLGYNLKTAIDDGNAVVIEPFHLYVGANDNVTDINLRNQDNMRKLYADVHKSLNSAIGKKYLVIDDLSQLISLGASVVDVVAFFQGLRTSQITDKDLAVIICTHTSEENSDQKLLSNIITHLSEFIITVSPLKTGFSSNVTGSIEVVDRLINDATAVSVKKYFHFKLTDRTCKLFAPGTTGIVT